MKNKLAIIFLGFTLTACGSEMELSSSALDGNSSEDLISAKSGSYAVYCMDGELVSIVDTHQTVLLCHDGKFGRSYLCDGHWKKIGKATYVCTPAGVDAAEGMSADGKKGKKSKKIDKKSKNAVSVDDLSDGGGVATDPNNCQSATGAGGIQMDGGCWDFTGSDDECICHCTAVQDICGGIVCTTC